MSSGETTSVRQVPLLDLSRPWQPLREEILAAVTGVFDDHEFILGSRVQRLEEAIAEYCGTRFAVGCNSGTDALLLALQALGLKPGDEVICPAFTFFATAGAVWNAGGRPVFVDIDEDTFNIDPQAVEAAITPRTRAIVPVHLFGRCADMPALMDIATGRDLAVIEDAAQAIGSELDGRRAGSFGTAGTLSFFPSKNLGGAGDGGMITTNDEALADHVRKARKHGSTNKYHHDFVGTNSRLDGIQGAVLLVKLPHLDGWTAGRQRNAAFYDEALAGLDGLLTPRPETRGRHVYNQYTVRSDRRDALQAHLKERGIGNAIYYPVPLHLQACFAELGGKPGDLPVTERLCGEVLSLPVFGELTEEERDYVVAGIREVHGSAA